jgi:hypothetical protein
MIPFLNIFSVLANFGAKYWKQICIAALALLIAAYVIPLQTGTWKDKKRLKELKKDKIEALNNRESAEKEIIANYTDSLKKRDERIRLIDLRLDSFYIALDLKDIQLNNIHNDVQKLVGDSLGIASELENIFARR